MLKKITTTLLISLLLIPITLFTGNLPPLMQMPTEEELAQVEQLLSTLSPEELEELSKLGEELIRTAEAEGRPLFGPTPDQAALPAPTPAPVVKQEPKPAVKPAPVQESSIPKKQLNNLQKMLSDLVDTLGEIRQKAASQEQLALMLVAINTQLNSLSYYLRTIAYSKHALRLSDKEFTTLKDGLTKLAATVDDLNNQLEVEEVSVNLKPNKQRQAFMVQQAQITLKNFISTINSTSTTVLPELETFMKKYEPEALELRKKQEAQEKEAAGQVKKLPTTNVGNSNPYLPSRPETAQQQKFGGGQNMTGAKFGAPTSGQPAGLQVKNAGGTSQPNQPGGQQGSQSGTTQNNAVKKDAPKKEIDKDKKEEELKDKEPTVDEQAQIIQKRLIDLNRRVQTGSKAIEDFKAYLAESPDEAVSPVKAQKVQFIGELTYEASKIKTTLQKWSDAIGKTAEWAEARKYKDAMQQIVDSTLGDLHSLAKTMTGILEDPANKDNKRIQSHKEDITDLKKAAADLSVVRIKPK